MRRVFRRRRGDTLQPQRFTDAVVRGLRMKSTTFDGQYQQTPVPLTGRIFNPNWWRYYKEAPEFEMVVLSVDCTFKSGKENDLVAIQKWGVVGVRSYLIERQTEHMGYIQTKAAIRSMQKHGRPASVILIEDKANGPAIVEELQADPDFGASVIAIDPQGDKVSRANAASTDVEAGSVYLPEGAEWVAAFVRTFAAFPGVRFDDDIDAASMFINWRRTRNLAYGVLDLGKRVLREIADGIRDAWGELIHKPAPKPVAVQARAQKEMRVEGKKRWEEKVPPCPHCKSTCTAWHSDGKGSVMVHCRQCGRDDGKDPGPNLGDTCPVPGCCIKLQTRGGNRWCQNHGIFPEHRLEDPVPPPGVSRRAHFARLGQFAIRRRA